MFARFCTIAILQWREILFYIHISIVTVIFHMLSQYTGSVWQNHQ